MYTLYDVQHRQSQISSSEYAKTHFSMVKFTFSTNIVYIFTFFLLLWGVYKFRGELLLIIELIIISFLEFFYFLFSNFDITLFLFYTLTLSLIKFTLTVIFSFCLWRSWCVAACPARPVFRLYIHGNCWLLCNTLVVLYVNLCLWTNFNNTIEGLLVIGKYCANIVEVIISQ